MAQITTASKTTTSSQPGLWFQIKGKTRVLLGNTPLDETQSELMKPLARGLLAFAALNLSLLLTVIILT